MTDTACTFCLDHPSVKEDVGRIKADAKNLENLVSQMHKDIEQIKRDVQEAIRNRYPGGIVFIISFLSSALSITTTLLITHILNR